MNHKFNELHELNEKNYEKDYDFRSNRCNGIE